MQTSRLVQAVIRTKTRSFTLYGKCPALVSAVWDILEQSEGMAVIAGIPWDNNTPREPLSLFTSFGGRVEYQAFNDWSAA